MKSEPRIWTPTFTMITGMNFLSSLVFYLLIVKIVEYAVAAYDVSYAAAGSMVSSYVIAGLLSRLLFGRKLDKWGFKRAALVGTAISSIATCLYLIDFGFAFLFTMRALHGVGMGISSSALGAAAAFVVPAERRGEGIGYFSLSAALSAGVGPFLAVHLTMGELGFSALFLCSAGFTVLTFLGAAALRIPKKASFEERVDAFAERRSLGLSSFAQTAVLPFAAVIFLVYMCYSGVVSYLTALCDDRGLVAASSLYFVVYSTIILISRPPMGRRVDRKGENSVAYCSLTLLAFGLLALAIAYEEAVLLVSAALMGFGVGVTQSTMQAIVAKVTPANELGRANSTYFAGVDLGCGVGPVIVGAFVPLVGYQCVYVGLACTSVFACALYHAVHGCRQRR